MAEVELVKENGNTSIFRTTFKDQKVEKTVEFEGPSVGKLKEYVASLSSARTKDERGNEVQSDVEYVYGELIYALKTHAIQGEREQVAQESTVITRDGRKIDLMDILLAKALLVIDSGFSMAAATDSAPQNALVASRKKLLAENKVKEVGESVKWSYIEKEDGVEVTKEASYRKLVAA